jgi:hypothetical protein
VNARFIAWINGDWVTLTVQPGQTLRWHTFEHHDEGWSSSSHQWSLEGGNLSEEMVDDGTDCDGRLTRYAEYVSRVEEIDSHKRPNWTEKSASQRDQFAELMNY